MSRFQNNGCWISDQKKTETLAISGLHIDYSATRFHNWSTACSELLMALVCVCSLRGNQCAGLWVAVESQVRLVCVVCNPEGFLALQVQRVVSNKNDLK